ncbi:MAG: prolipoprotein diacylglyceryl transferase, partial [Ardenticatenales bacterium]|nr:prolipoprotein diacylglyceryl transferase [Ardenticatenales bacterium]
MYPVLRLLGLTLPTRGLLVVFSLWVGLEVLERLAARRGLNQQFFSTAGLLTIGSTLIGARLFYALRYPQGYLQQPLALLSPNAQGLAWT